MKLVRLLAAGFSMALRRTVAFRIDLLFDVVLSLVRLGSALVAVLIVFTRTDSLAGWTKAESLVLIGTFQLITGIKGTFIDPNLSWFPNNGIRNGKLDSCLLQPAPSLFLASLSQCAPLALLQLILGAGVLFLGVADNGTIPGFAGIVGWLILIVVAVVVTWALGVLLACLAFWAPRLQLDVFYFSVWQVARYPADIFSRPIRMVLTYIFPMALIASVPSSMLLRGAKWNVIIGCAVGAACLALLANGVWRIGLKRYTGATS